MPQPFPLLTSERLRLRMPCAADIPLIVEYAGNPKIAATTLNIPHPYAEKDAIFWLHSVHQGFENGTQYTLAVELLAEEKFIGGVGLRVNHRFNRAELGYWIAEPYWGRGYCSEAAGRLLKYGFEELGLHKIYATHLVDNPASGKVMMKNGMIKEAELVEHVLKGGEYRTIIQYRLTRREFEERH